MSAKSKNMRDTFVDQLASFDDKLVGMVDGNDLRVEIELELGQLLASSLDSEEQIRSVLQTRLDEDAIGKDRFELVTTILDRYITEDIVTSPTGQIAVASLQDSALDVSPVAVEMHVDDAFGATTVIPQDIHLTSSSESTVQVGSVLRDRYVLQEKVAGGSMGVVYKAMDRRLAEAGSTDHWVAVKVLSPLLAENVLALRALQQEAAKGRCLVHPNIVRFIDLDRDDELYFMVMEWLEGRTLANILDSKDAATIDNDAAFRIVSQIGDALDYAHRCGIVHADVKPGNIMILPGGDAKLFDFGVARARQEHPGSGFDPGVLGALTPAYSSMQVLTGEEPVAADDVFSLSCLLYRLIAGYRVFGPRNAAEASEFGMKPQRLKALSDSQWRALKKGLAYARIARFSSVSEFVIALTRVDDEAVVIDEPKPLDSGGGKSAMGKWLLFFLVVVGAAAGVAYQQGYLAPLWEKYAGQIQARSDVPDPSVIDSATTDPAFNAPSAADSLVVDPLPLAPSTIDDKQAQNSSAAIDESAPQAQISREVEAIESVVPGPLDAVQAARLQPADAFAIEQHAVLGPDSMLVNFSRLPAPTRTIPFSPGSRVVQPVRLVIREDGPQVVIDFIRNSRLATPLELRLEEVGFSGNRSPWAAGQLLLSNSGRVHFPAGQARGRVTLSMASDTLREADQQSTLRLREVEFADSAMAVIHVTLQDDDQRDFESQLPKNTVAFTASRASIREADPAVQIDLVRFNPDQSHLHIPFSVSDITASEGKDYFAPSEQSVEFGPGQRSARLLLPLVQDASAEGTESFVIELISGPNTTAIGVHRRIVVDIQDDDPQPR